MYTILKSFYVKGIRGPVLVEQVKGKGKQDIFYIAGGVEMSNETYFTWLAN